MKLSWKTCLAALFPAAGIFAGTTHTILAGGQAGRRAAREAQAMQKAAGFVNGLTIFLVISVTVVAIIFFVWQRWWSGRMKH